MPGAPGEDDGFDDTPTVVDAGISSLNSFEAARAAIEAVDDADDGFGGGASALPPTTVGDAFGGADLPPTAIASSFGRGEAPTVASPEIAAAIAREGLAPRRTGPPLPGVAPAPLVVPRPAAALPRPSRPQIDLPPLEPPRREKAPELRKTAELGAPPVVSAAAAVAPAAVAPPARSLAPFLTVFAAGAVFGFVLNAVLLRVGRAPSAPDPMPEAAVVRASPGVGSVASDPPPATVPAPPAPAMVAPPTPVAPAPAAAMNSAPALAAVSPPIPGIAVERSGADVSLALALRGSTAGMVYFPSPKPHGVVVRFPAARPVAAVGVHRLGPDLPQVKVLRKGRGSVIGFFYPRVVAGKVGLAGQDLRLTLRP